jgi:predicted peptidase
MRNSGIRDYDAMNQQAHIFHTGPDGIALPYLVALPSTYSQDPAQRWPLLLFLHGRGERGNDMAVLRKHGLPKVVDAWTDTPFIAVSPQCPETANWEELTETLAALLDDLIATYAVDTQRVYLTGLSMGGRGGWRLAVRYPDRFAALALICGRIPDLPDFFERLPLLKTTPIWVFHGAKDPVVPIENSDKIVAALEAMGGNVRYTLYPEALHDSWTATYNNPELFTWLLQQSLREKSVP